MLTITLNPFINKSTILVKIVGDNLLVAIPSLRAMLHGDGVASRISARLLTQ